MSDQGCYACGDMECNGVACGDAHARAEADVADDAPFLPIFDDEGWFRGPVQAAFHATYVQGGFSTPEIEAERMIADGGVLKERAEAWLAQKEREGS